MPVRNEQRAQGAAEMLYRSTQYLGQPLGAVLKRGKAFRQRYERADLQQPIKLQRMRSRVDAVARLHFGILGNAAWSAN